MRAAPWLAAMIAAFCVEAMAETRPPVEGRWVAEKRNLTLDVSRCGAGWCGVEVVDGKTCGAVALRFEPVLTSNDPGVEWLSGRLELASEPHRYAVQVSFFQRNDRDPIKLIISGNTGDKFEPWRRNYPFRELLARTGDAVCPPLAKVS
jgi:hypothetical protein